jgi:hypothetical protein
MFMKCLILKSWLTLLRADLTVRFLGFKAVHRALSRGRGGQATNLNRRSIEEVCHAVDLACVFYVWQVSPLERSAAATLVLRRYGYQADLVLGAQIFPCKTHAWVEIEGRIVNDQPNLLDAYQVLERC